MWRGKVGEERWVCEESGCERGGRVFEGREGV